MQTTTPELTMEEEIVDTMENRYLAFVVNQQEYAIEITYIIEIVQIQRITPIPNVAHYVKGVINLRGQVIPVIDMRLRFGLPSQNYDDRTCIIVVKYNSTLVGLIVDRVEEVFEVEKSHINTPPSLGNQESDQLVKGIARVGDDIKLLLDVQHILFGQGLEDQIRMISQLHSKEK